MSHLTLGHQTPWDSPVGKCSSAVQCLYWSDGWMYVWMYGQTDRQMDG